MRNFADVVRLPLPKCEQIDLNHLVQEVVVFMQSFAAGKGISLEMHPAIDAPVYIQADLGQLEQVLVNVFKNAIEASESGQKVELRLNPHQLIIRDNGKPISPEQSAQLFNPFYSSKPDGQGIGLTLSREILLNHGFSFSLKTGDDGWTEFLVGF